MTSKHEFFSKITQEETQEKEISIKRSTQKPAPIEIEFSFPFPTSFQQQKKSITIPFFTPKREIAFSNTCSQGLGFCIGHTNIFWWNNDDRCYARTNCTNYKISYAKCGHASYSCCRSHKYWRDFVNDWQQQQSSISANAKGQIASRPEIQVCTGFLNSDHTFTQLQFVHTDLQHIV